LEEAAKGQAVVTTATDEVEEVETANNMLSDDDNFSDWEMIEYEEAALALSA